MLNLIKMFLPKVSAFASLVAILASIGLYLYSDSLSSKNKLLAADIASNKAQLDDANAKLKRMQEDQAIREKVLAENAKAKAAGEKELSKLKAEMKRLVNESKDECLSRTIPPDILNKLRQ